MTATESLDIRALSIDADAIGLSTEERLETIWIPVWAAQELVCGGNPKLHDLQALAESFRDYGFQDPPKWDSTLNDGKGGIVFGNGRVECLARMEGDWDRPRGIGVDPESGRWVMPIKVGLDLVDQEQALKFLVDHNNLTLSGGTLTALDTSRMYDSGRYLEILRSVGSTLTVDGDDIELIQAFHDEPLDLSGEGDSDAEGEVEGDDDTEDESEEVRYILKYDEDMAQEFEEMLAALAAEYEIEPIHYADIVFQAVQSAYRAAITNHSSKG